MTWRIGIGSVLIALGIGFVTHMVVFRYLLPFLLVWLGLTIVFRKQGIGEIERKHIRHTARLREAIVFASRHVVVASNTFVGGKVLCISGGTEIDLRNVLAAVDTVEMEIVALTGGVRVRVPENWLVKSEGVAAFGDYAVATNMVSKKPVYFIVKGVALFGVVEIVH